MLNKEMTDLHTYLRSLAARYETKEFLVGDPSWFMHQVEGDSDKELLAFMAAALSYGSRKQFLPKIDRLLCHARDYSLQTCATLPHDGIIRRWIEDRAYADVVPDDDACFYRLYTNRTMNGFLQALADIVTEYGSLKNLVSTNAHDNTAIEAIRVMTEAFRERGSKGVIPKDTSSSCKRVCMFLRWMVRDNSHVDLGLWTDIIDKRSLIIPMDTHVVQEAMRLGLITSRSTSMANAMKLSRKLAECFPDDPARGDFALFGVGVDDTKGHGTVLLSS